MASSCVMLVLSLTLAFLTLSAAQAPTMPPSSDAAPPTMSPFTSPPAPVAFPPTMSPGPSVSSPAAPDMAPEMPASPPAPVGPGPVSAPAPAPGPSDGGPADSPPSSAFVHGSSMAMVALIGSAALFF